MSDRAPTADDPTRQLIEEEHRQLRATLGQLAEDASLRATLEHLDKLRGLLVPHFEREEAAQGFAKLIQESAIPLAERMEEIFGEHRELLAEVDRLSELGRETLAGPVRDILDGAHRLSERLHEHEAKETALIMDAFYRDLGGG